MEIKIITAVAAAFFSVSTVATTLTYTETPAGVDTVALGYPVPLPIDSLLPVDGFRRYASLHARHVQMDSDTDLITAINLGSTRNGRPIWAYQFSDADDVVAEGLAREGGMLINGGIHAREWQSPEVTTAIMEALFDGRSDASLHQYLLENIRLIMIPVLNVDGFLQTQRFPDKVMRSTFSADPTDWPRDGRMRRKNMLGVDEDLFSEGDNLFGVDLNRNNNPFWASTNRSSNDTGSLVHHGSGPGSESETQALYQAGALFSSDQLRFYIDVHSFSQLYFVNQNGTSRTNAIAVQLGDLMRRVNNNRYTLSVNAPNTGIGSTEDYFGATFQIPSYTLEIEPVNSASQYGGFGVTHDGFILPENQIARVRKELTDATMLAFYAQAGAPVMMSAELVDLSFSTTVARLQWQNTDASTRSENSVLNETPKAGQPYRLTLTFDKPMRYKTASGDVGQYPGMNVMQTPAIQLVAESQSGALTVFPLTLQNSTWLKAADKHRYDFDRFRTEFVWPVVPELDSLLSLRFHVDAPDMAGVRLDSNPQSIARFENGSWQGLEDSNNSAADVGGIDKNFAIKSSGRAPIFQGGLQNQIVQSGQAINFQFSATAFIDPEGEALSYEASTGSGAALPSWLQFSASERRFSGTPTATGTTTVNVTAIDPPGNRTTASFTITVNAVPPVSSGGGGGAMSWLGWLGALVLLGAGRRIRRSRKMSAPGQSCDNDLIIRLKTSYLSGCN